MLSDSFCMYVSFELSCKFYVQGSESCKLIRTFGWLCVRVMQAFGGQGFRLDGKGKKKGKGVKSQNNDGLPAGPEVIAAIR